MRVSDYLGRGQQNAISLRRLSAMIGENPRSIRREIELERRHGTPVLSDNLNGYFLPENEAEARRFVKSMRGRAHEILTTASAVEAAYAEALGQEVVEVGVR